MNELFPPPLPDGKVNPAQGAQRTASKGPQSGFPALPLVNCVTFGCDFHFYGLGFLVCEMKACPGNLCNLRTMPGNLCEATGASGVSLGGGNRNEEINSLGVFPLSLTDRTIVADTESNSNDFPPNILSAANFQLFKIQ